MIWFGKTNPSSGHPPQPQTPGLSPTPLTPPPKSDEEVEKLISELREAARQAGMQRDDPLMPLLNAFARVIRFLGERNAKSERVATETSQRIVDTLATTRAVANAQVEYFRTQLAATEADTIQRIAASIARSADDALKRRVVTLGHTVSIVAACVLFSVAIGCLGGGYWWGYSNATAGIPQAEAVLRAALSDNPVDTAQWVNLITWNHIAHALLHCAVQSTVQAGRRACDVPLWIEAKPSSIPESLPTNETVDLAPPTPPPAPPARPTSKPPKPFDFLPLPPTGPLHFGPAESR